MNMRDIQLERESRDIGYTSVANLQDTLTKNHSCEVLTDLIGKVEVETQKYHDSVARARAPFFTITSGLTLDVVAAVGVRGIVSSMLLGNVTPVSTLAHNLGGLLMVENGMLDRVHAIDKETLKMRVAGGITLVDIVTKALPRLFRVNLERESKVKTTWMVSPTKVFDKLVEENHEIFNIFRSKMMPMVHKPDPWTAMTGGGYLSPVAKKLLPLVKRKAQHPMPIGDTLFCGINHMQDTPFRVNQPIFKLIKELQGIRPEEMHKVFPRDLGEFVEECPIDKEEDAYLWEKVEGLRVDKKTGKEKVAQVLLHVDEESKLKRKSFFSWKAKKLSHEKKMKARTSLNSSYQTCIDLIETVEGFDELFWPLSQDNRSRVYPTAMTGINLHGSDVQKAGIEFAVGLPIGSASGVYAIQKSMCNHWGKDSGNGVKTDKLNKQQSMVWVAEATPWIRECVASPLENRQWMKADKPFQFMVAAMEWVGWLDYNLEHGEGDYGYIHRLCDQNDASCSGAQILSATVRDEVGAFYTNLTNTDVQDLYMSVAKKVIDNLVQGFDNRMYQDWLGRDGIICAITLVLEGGHHEILTEESQALIQELSGTNSDVVEIFYKLYPQLTQVERERMCLITRELVKKPVMVKFYSGTKFGNIKHCREMLLELELENSFEEDTVGAAGSFMGGLIYDSINQVISGAGMVMDYFVHAAGILGGHNLTMKWTTLIGFNATMSKKKEETIHLRVKFRDGELKKFSISVPKVTEVDGKLVYELDVAKMRSGIAPDVVHSLDSSLIIAVAARCKAEGIDHLWMVHDSLGCHCCYSEQFNRIIREEFIRLFSGDVLGDIYRGWRSQLEGHLRGLYGDDYHTDMLGELFSPEEFGIKMGTWKLEEMLESEFCFK